MQELITLRDRIQEQLDAVNLTLRLVGGEPVNAPAATTAAPAPATATAKVAATRKPRAVRAEKSGAPLNLRQACQRYFGGHSGAVTCKGLRQWVREHCPGTNPSNMGICLRRMIAAGEIEELPDGQYRRATSQTAATLASIKAEIGGAAK